MSRYTNFYVFWLIFSVMVIKEKYKYCSSSININNCHKRFCHHILYGYHCHRDFDVIYWLIMVYLYQYLCLVNQIQCLGYQNISGNGSCSMNMSKWPTFPPIFWDMNIFLPKSIVYLKNVYIDPDTPISNSWDSTSVSCSIQNSRKWLYLHKYEELPQYLSLVLCGMGIDIQ